MSTPHHGHNDLAQRFIEESFGQAKREYPHGRIGADDDGVLTFAIATDVPHQSIIIQFSQATKWIGLDQKAAEELRDQLTQRLFDLRGITV